MSQYCDNTFTHAATTVAEIQYYVVLQCVCVCARAAFNPSVDSALSVDE